MSAITRAKTPRPKDFELPANPARPDALVVPPAPADGGAPILLSIVLPTYNESKNIHEAVERLSRLLDGAVGQAYEIIVVDDDSPDRTWEVAGNLVARFPQLRVIRRVGERGLATAVIRGWQAARGQVLGVMDADLQHPPEANLGLYAEIRAGADLAVATRYIEGGGVSDWSFLRRAISRGAQLLGLMILPGVVGRVADPMSGYMMVRREALEGIELSPLGYKILVEVLARGRINWVAEVPYVFRERVAGESKVTRKVYIDYLRHLARLRLDSPAARRFVRFAAVGFSGVFVDMGFLYLLSDPSTLHWGLTRSKVIAAQLAIVNNFYWNDRWTFGDISARETDGRQKLHRFLSFEAVCLMGLVLNAILLNVQFNLLGMNRYVANLIAIAIVTGWNYWLNLKLSWRVTGPRHG